MRRFLLLGAVLVGGVIATRRLLSTERRESIRQLCSATMQRMMDRMMKGMPEGAPPKLVISILPRLREQNDQILALLQEQNELLRERPAPSVIPKRKRGGKAAKGAVKRSSTRKKVQ